MEGIIGLAAVTAPFLMVVAIVVWPKILRAREQAEMQATVRTALDKGQPLPPELIEAMTKSVPEAPKQPSSRSRDFRQGIIWLAVGIGIALFSLVSSMGWRDPWGDSFGNGMLGVATIPATIGAAFLVLGLLNKNRD